MFRVHTSEVKPVSIASCGFFNLVLLPDLRSFSIHKGKKCESVELRLSAVFSGSEVPGDMLEFVLRSSLWLQAHFVNN